MAMRSNPTARQLRLGAELRKMREAAGMTARETATLLGVNSTQITHIETGLSGVSEVRLRRLAAHYACPDEALVDGLVELASKRPPGWWEEYHGVLPQVFLDVAEVEHHATLLHEVVVSHVPGLLQTPDYARAVFGYMVPELPESELEPRVEHRMKRRAVLDRDQPPTYETIVHETALRIMVSDRQIARVQLQEILGEIERAHTTVRIIPFDREGFAGAGIEMMHIGGPVPPLDTVLRDAPHGTAFLDAESQLVRFRTLFRKVEKASLDPVLSRDFIHRMSKEL